MIKILNVVGVRPNFIKIAPLLEEMRSVDSISPLLLHTGQHYDGFMSDSFFRNLDIQEPDIDLGVSSESSIRLIAEIMIRAEAYLNETRPDLIVLVGDANSTLAMALVGNKMNIPIAHIEAGLRSRNFKMQEEYNRIITDRFSELLFTPTGADFENLLDGGIDREKIFFVGNIMIDSLLKNMEKASDNKEILQNLNIKKQYALITLHRPECVDIPKVFNGVLNAFGHIQNEIALIWALHPRTKKNIEKFNFQNKIDSMPNLKIIEPVGYLDMLVLMKSASFVMTDSGGVQEETTALRVPCLTLRDETERPITTITGTNKVVGMNASDIINSAEILIADNTINSEIPPLWDGKAAKRIVDIILAWSN